jgi:uncharacterized protein
VAEKTLRRGGIFFALSVLSSSVLWVAPLRAEPHFPSTKGYVTDAAGVLSESAREQLENQLTAFTQKTSIQMAIVTVASLEGDTIEDYSAQLMKRWGIGEKGKNNGVLLLAAIQDRKVRIEVGYGLESVLPDGRAGEIILKNILPHFHQGQYDEGLREGMTAIVQTLGGPEQIPSRQPPPVGHHLSSWILPLLGLFLIFPFTVLTILFSASFYISAPTPLHALGFLSIPFGLLLDIFRFRGRGGRSAYFGGGYGGFGGGGFSSGGGGGFGGFGGGMSGGGGASGGW